MFQKYYRDFLKEKNTFLRKTHQMLLYRSHQILLFHYAVDAILLVMVAFSIFSIVQATTPNPGHPWIEIGDGAFAVTYNQTALRTYTFPDASATVLTTNALVTVAQGGTGLGTLTLNNVMLGNGTATPQFVAPGTLGNVLYDNGTTWISSPGHAGDMVLAGVQTVTGAKTFLDTTLLMRNVANTFNGSFKNTNTADRIYTLPNYSDTLATLAGSEALTTKTYNGLTVTNNGTNTLNIAAGKTLTVSNSLTLSGTDGTTMTFPTTSASIARTDAAQTFTGIQTFGPSSTYDPILISPVAKGTTSYNGTITSADLTAARNWTFPDNGGTVALTSDLSGFISSESDTLSSVTGRGATTSTASSFTGGLTSPSLLGGTTTTSPLTLQTTSGVGTTGADMHFKVGNNGATEALTILNSGNVGIGKTTPGAALEVNSSSYPVGKFVRTLSSGSGIWGGNALYASYTSASDGFGVSQDFGIKVAGTEYTLGTIGAVRSGANNSGSLVIQTNNSGSITEKMRVDNNGNIGIGITNPAVKLDVAGQVKFTSTTFPVVDIYRDTTTTGGQIYGGAKLERLMTGGTALAGSGIGFYFKNPNSAGTSTYTGLIGGGLSTVTAGSEIGFIGFKASYNGIDPGNNSFGLKLVATSSTTDDATFSGNVTVNGTGNSSFAGNVGVGVSSPTAVLNLKAGTSTANTAPLKFTSGTNLATTEAGAVEYDGSHLYFTATNAGTRFQLDQQTPRLDQITAANTTSSIDSLNNAITWNWSTATTQNPFSLSADGLSTGSLFSLSSNGTAAGASQKGINISLAGTNATSAITSYGAYLSNTHAGTTSTNVGLYATASGGTTANYAGIFDQGRVLIGSTTESTSSAPLSITGSTAANGSTSALAGILGSYTFNPTAGGVQVGNRFVVTNSPTTSANTMANEIVRVVDNTALANTVYGIDITTNAGSNTAGTNTGIRATSATFGLQAITSGLGGAVSVPAAIFAQNTGTTQGDILRLYSQTVTSATSYANFYQDTSTFTGTGLLMKFATGSGTFSGNFIDLQKNNTSVFKVTNAGVTSLGLSGTASTTAVCSSLATGTAPTAGTAYELRDCSGAPVADYAEMYPVEKGIEYGDIVTTGTEIVNTYDIGADGNIDWKLVKGNVSKLVKSSSEYQNNVIGIVSDNHNDFSSTGYNIKDSDNPMPVALNGRVPVKISSDSQEIKTGDYLTSSEEAGMATKALKSGFVIGKALEDWTPSSGKKTIMIFVEQGYYQNDSINNFSSETTFGGLTYFNADVSFAQSIKFNGQAEFMVPPLFNSDTAGFAVIKAGDNKVDVIFDQAYLTQPIVTANITFENNGVKMTDQQIADFFGENIKSVIVNKNQNQFTIQINKIADEDIKFSWVALAVKDPKIFESVLSGLIIEPTTIPVVSKNIPTPTPDTTPTLDKTLTASGISSADSASQAPSSTTTPTSDIAPTPKPDVPTTSPADLPAQAGLVPQAAPLIVPVASPSLIAPTITPEITTPIIIPTPTPVSAPSN